MKNLWNILFIIPLAICLSTTTHAQGTDYQAHGMGYQSQGKLGVGLVFGEPTGFSWKYRINDINAIDGAVGVSPYDRYRLHVDYLWQSHPFNEQRLMLHYGPGIAIGGATSYYTYTDRGYFLHSEELGFGIRGDIGLDYQIKSTPLELYFETAPMVIMAPGIGSGLDLGFGGRFFF